MKQLSLEETIIRLENKGYTVKQSGGTYRSQCPAHDGKDLNLAFKLGDNGQVMFTCHSHNCTFEEIMQSLGVEKNDGSKPPKKVAYGKNVHPTLEKAMSAAAFGVGIRRKPDSVYRYDNLDGSENMLILRWDTEQGKQTRPISKLDGGYICGTRSDKAYPTYRLPQVVKSLKTQARLYICEGEKATDAAISIGLPATTSAFGSQNTTKTDWAILDRIATEHNIKPEIVILPDNDKPGLQYAESLVDVFTQFKSKPIVKIVSLAEHGSTTGVENIPKGGDFYDLLELLDGKSVEEIRDMIETMVDESLPETEIFEDQLQWEPFPIELLPSSIGRLCTESAQAKNIEPVHVAINALAAVASVIGSAYKIELKKDWREPAILWTCLVADSGSGKTPGLDSAVAPLRLIQKHADDSYDLQCRNYEEDRESYNLEYDDWKRNKKKRNTEESPEKPIAPTLETLIVDDATLEAVAEVLEGNPFGILLLKDELASWLNSFDCYRSSGGSKDLPSWLSIHGGKPFRINRKTGKKVIRSNNPAVSLCGGIQPNVLFRIVKDNDDFFDSGLTARILFAMPPDKPMHWTEVETSDEAIAMYENIFRTLWSWRRSPSMPTPDEPFIVRLSEDAKELFVRFFNSNSDERTILDGDLKASWAKFAGYAARLALVFHVVQRIEDDGPMHILKGDSMQRAIRLILWFKRETARILKFLRQTKCAIDFEAQAILETIEKNDGTITVRDLQRHRSKYRGRGGIQRATTILESLAEQGKLVVSAIRATNGKAINRYSLQCR